MTIVDRPAVLAIPGDSAAQFLVTRVRAQPQPARQRREAQRQRDRPEQQRAQAEVPVGQLDAAWRFAKAPCGRPSIGLSLTGHRL
jgi:hypothetical protein